MVNTNLKLDSNEIILKIKTFEIKKEINKFFLIMFISGYIGIFSSFIEYYFHFTYNLDVTFYIFQDFGGNNDLSISVQPFLFVLIWSIHLLPLFAIFLFTSERSGIIDFSKSYKRVAILALILFIVAESSVLLFTRENYKLIPVIWGIVIAIGLILTGTIFYQDFKIKIISQTMFVCSLLTIFEVIGVYFFVDDHLGPTIITFSIGIMLIAMSIIIYYLKKQGKIIISIEALDLESNIEQNQEQNITETVEKNLDLINNHLKNTFGISEWELFDYMSEARDIMIKSRIKNYS